MISFACLLAIQCAVVLLTDASMVVKFAVDPLHALNNISMEAGPPPECADLIDQHMSLFKVEDANSVVDNIETLCIDYQKVAGCVRAVRPYTDQILQTHFDIMTGVWDFLCSDKGKSVLKVIEESPCFDNQEKSEALEELVELCVNGTAPKNSEDHKSTCTYLRHYEECVYNIYKEECGEPAAILSHEMNLAVYRAMPIHRACFPEQAVEIHATDSLQM